MRKAVKNSHATGTTIKRYKQSSFLLNTNSITIWKSQTYHLEPQQRITTWLETCKLEDVPYNNPIHPISTCSSMSLFIWNPHCYLYFHAWDGHRENKQAKITQITNHLAIKCLTCSIKKLVHNVLPWRLHLLRTSTENRTKDKTSVF